MYRNIHGSSTVCCKIFMGSKKSGPLCTIKGNCFSCFTKKETKSQIDRFYAVLVGQVNLWKIFYHYFLVFKKKNKSSFTIICLHTVGFSTINTEMVFFDDCFWLNILDTVNVDVSKHIFAPIWTTDWCYNFYLCIIGWPLKAPSQIMWLQLCSDLLVNF